MPPLSQYFDIVTDGNGRERMEVSLTGIALLRLVLTNKGTAFTREERAALEIDGLLPPAVNTLDQQVERALRGYRAESTPLHRYQFLRALQERQEILFYALLERHLEEMLPIVYTPTVGEAVKQFSALYQYPRGLSLSPENIERADDLVDGFPLADVRMIVATDSSAILGIGDQGYGGLAIPIGKLALYTVGGGVSPFHTMPVSLDVGTDREDLLADPYYLGTRRRRMRGAEYLEFIDRFVGAISRRWPRAVIQWEDLAKDTAFAVHERYRETTPSFNDDIQGTGAVALAGVLSACRLLGEPLARQTIVVHGAGAGGAGVAAELRRGLLAAGLSGEEATARLFVLDSRGLLVEGRQMEDYKRPFAQPRARLAGWKGDVPDLLETVERTQATVLLGLSGQPGAFTELVVRTMARNAPRPVIFPLSNPNASAEAQPANLIGWTDGRALVAAGSPFPAIERGGTSHRFGQGNNAFVFPGLGAAAVLGQVTRVTDAMVTEAAHAVADYTAAHHADSLYPPIAALPEVSVQVAARVLAQAQKDGVTRSDLAGDHPGREALVRRRFWRAQYLPVVRAKR
jgi:malate dehydrogenase (oxaloacetate-decarboxylating)